MMAIAALSLAHRSGTQIAEASEHYAQVLTAMGQFVHNEPIWYSDGPLFTHYLLLLYEVSNTGSMQGLNLSCSLPSNPTETASPTVIVELL